MNVRGRMRNGVVELDGDFSLPDGTEVVVLCPDAVAIGPDGEGRQIDFPLVPSQCPGSIELTAERVAELLEEADVSA